MILIRTDKGTTYVKGAFIVLQSRRGAPRARAVRLGLSDDYGTSYGFGAESVETLILHSMYSYVTGMYNGS